MWFEEISFRGFPGKMKSVGRTNNREPFHATASFAHHLVAICEFKLDLHFGKAQIKAKFVILKWPLTLTLRMDITFVNDNNCWKFYDMMTGTLWKRCDRKMDAQTDRWTDRSILRAAWSQLKMSHDWEQITVSMYWPMHCFVHMWQYPGRI